jgi:4'-phosphopantetheinyl transferase
MRIATVDGPQAGDGDSTLATPCSAIVVRIALDQPPLDPGVLDGHELARAGRLVFDRDRRRFIAAHSAMRVILGRQLGVNPRTLRFGVGRHGKPYLLDNPSDARFNLSHSGERAVLAVTIGREVGIDIEQHRPIDIEAISRFSFSQAECDALDQLPPSARLDGFYRCWTRKESFVKARGDGLSFDLGSFDVSLEDERRQLLVACRTKTEDLDLWTIVNVPADTGYSSAVTIEGHDMRLTTQEQQSCEC